MVAEVDGNLTLAYKSPAQEGTGDSLGRWCSDFCVQTEFSHNGANGEVDAKSEFIVCLLLAGRDEIGRASCRERV